MKVFVLTRTAVSEKGGTLVHKPLVFYTKDDAKKGMYNDIDIISGIYNDTLKEFLILHECDYYSYCYICKILGFTKIAYKIWEIEL